MQEEHLVLLVLLGLLDRGLLGLLERGFHVESKFLAPHGGLHGPSVPCFHRRLRDCLVHRFLHGLLELHRAAAGFSTHAMGSCATVLTGKSAVAAQL